MFKEYIKAIVTTSLRIILRIFYLLPLKKQRIIFESFNGKLIGCNPYYIYQALLKEHPDYQYIWCYNKKSNNTKTTHYVSKNSLAYIYHLLTARIYITNDSVPQYIPFRKKQIVINTWHGGGAYKKVGMELGKQCNWYNQLNLRRTSQSTTYFISSSKGFSNAAPKAYLISPSKILPFGMPRNDIFFNNKEMNIANNKIRSLYKISDKDFVVLYAPTFRKSKFNLLPDFELISKAIKDKFKCQSVCFLVRAHHTISSAFSTLRNNWCIDVSDYPYMQDLLCTAQMLISDYSSCIWDYSYTYRPCILYTPDLLEYQSDRDFHNPIKTWGFPIAQTNEELLSIIHSFNKNLFKESMIKHHDFLKSYESGTATSQICQLIEQKIRR